ncbi:helix-turn-helix transcriptional regulator [Notoacmeibacter ruber]|uniref:AraC family transcriptional regulator n=1 Tax=Notoacmeibacter ruber TaxID=2670375 RepID=A0A3L7JJ90_9HYPH|nr:AraC family transcriptional regulator [Notoacmeibacter ruber]RLQ88552.1 AraC family transcriptional regulator [Notoacmeibacter ruber]
MRPDSETSQPATVDGGFEHHLPALPQRLFVGALEGVRTCTLDDEEHPVWPKFMVMILLQGSQQFFMDGVEFRLDAGDNHHPRPTALLLNVARFCSVRFGHDSQTTLRKVMISAPRPWLQRLMDAQQAEEPCFRNFLGVHLATFQFEPGRHIVRLAEQIMRPPAFLQGEMLTLHKQSRAFEIIWQCWGSMLQSCEPLDQSPSLLHCRQCETVRQYILDNLQEELTIETIAAEAGLSVSTLQRYFRECFNMTVFEFIRQERLSRARAALEKEGVPIAEAAYIAGYNSISSFTTAFRKAYGLTPKRVRG